MEIGVTILTYGPETGPEEFDKWGALAEQLGFHFLMITDHVTAPPQVAANFPAQFYDPFTTLAWRAGRTRGDLLALTDLVASGAVAPVVERQSR